MKPTDAKGTIPLCVGYSITKEGQMPFPEIVRTYRAAIGEVYFSFFGCPGGRSAFGEPQLEYHRIILRYY